jgi:glycosyltransferase involved in cell wall biosynthesis
LKASAIVTTYNNPDALLRVLKGLSLQTKHPDEVIVADDGSGPETAQLVFDFSKGATFPVRHVWQEDQGFRAARIRNEAVKQADGDYIIFMDGDCVPNRHYVADHLALSERDFFVQGKRILLDRKASKEFSPEHANSVGDIFKNLLCGHIGNPHHLLRMPFVPPSRSTGMRGIKTCSFGVFREAVLAVNGFNEAFIGWGREDSEFAARLYKYGLRRKGHPFMAICFHLWHPENPRESLSRNDALLAETLAGEGYRCMRGIVDEASKD